MAEKKKRARDVNALAFQITQEAIQEKQDDMKDTTVPLGRPGGLVGGKARKEKLTPEQRKNIAHVAATARWKKTDR